MLEEGKKNADTQIMKRHNEQPEFNSQVKNEDALYKFLAYSGVLEKKRRENLDKTRKNNELVYGVENFEEFYKQELQRDAKRDPRPINPTDYQQKRVDNSKAGEGFLTAAEREAQYFNEFEIYKENKSKCNPLLIKRLYRGAAGEKSGLLRVRAVLCSCQTKPRSYEQGSGGDSRLLQGHRKHFLLRQEQDLVRVVYISRINCTSCI